MEWSFLFFFNSALLGVGLAMDAFSVSMANGLHDPQTMLSGFVSRMSSPWVKSTSARLAASCSRSAS